MIWRMVMVMLRTTTANLEFVNINGDSQFGFRPTTGVKCFNFGRYDTVLRIIDPTGQAEWLTR